MHACYAYILYFCQSYSSLTISKKHFILSLGFPTGWHSRTPPRPGMMHSIRQWTTGMRDPSTVGFPASENQRHQSRKTRTRSYKTFFVKDPFHGISHSSKMHFVPFLEISPSHIHRNSISLSSKLYVDDKGRLEQIAANQLLQQSEQKIPNRCPI